MDDQNSFEDVPELRSDYAKLAHWLQQVLQTSSSTKGVGGEEDETHLAPLLGSDYHLHFYQQLPDFAMALLTHDPQATIRYAPLLYHLVGCSECHSGYLDIYDALRAAIEPQEPRPVLGQGTRTLAATPQRMLGHLCQALISQAAAVLRQARHDHADQDVFARSLLQLALSVSSHIGQSGIRHQALQDLVHVATLFDGPSPPKEEDPGTHTYTLAVAGTTRGGKKVVRRALARSVDLEQPIINLQSRSLYGMIIQRERVLELHLQDLDEALRGHSVIISIPLGSLLESVNWVSDNPRAIRSIAPVDASGMLVTPLGQTTLQLSHREDHNILEAVFMRIDVQADI